MNRRDYLKKFIKELKSIREFVGDNCNKLIVMKFYTGSG
jgi:hypothetical protein